VQKTYMARPADIKHEWFVIDAQGQPLGKVAALAASIIRGKHKPTYTPGTDCGDNVIVVNAAKVVLTGRKADQKKYYHFSGYPGGLKVQTFRELISKRPERVVEHAVFGMLPHNRLGRSLHRHLKVYAGPEHPHQAQKPRLVNQ